MTPLLLYAACVVSEIADPQSYFTTDEVQERAEVVTRACGYDMGCIRTVTVLWRIEANLEETQNGCCGPLQVIPVKSVTPSCAEMRAHREAGVQGGWLMFEAKRAVAVRLSKRNVLARAFRFYNGVPVRQDRYSKRAMGYMRRIDSACGVSAN